MYKKLIFAALGLTLIVVVVGAYVRLEDAGLGCPDWPGCYGHWVGIPDQAHEIERAAQAFPDSPVRAHKAWKEMFHRYVAGALGVLITVIAAISWLKRRALRQSPLLASAILLVVALQAMLGMWTVTMLLKPAIVTLHLLGGMATVGLLTWLALRQLALPSAGVQARRLRPWAVLGLLVVIAQIALGGWVAANYAALVCPDLPTCRGAWIPAMDFEHAFQFGRDLGVTAAGSALTIEALTAIHWTHRLGALVTFLYLAVLALALLLLRIPRHTRHGLVLALLLLVQMGLGIANVMLGLPLSVAVAHNGVAAALLLTMVVINFALSRRGEEANTR